MENLSHTLLGLALSKAGLDKSTPLATTALVVSSNLPDIDFIVSFRRGALSYIEHHRGITHSFVGIAVLSAILTLVLTYVDRRLRLRRDPFFRPARPMRIFWLSILGCLGHLLMDYTNNYGLRPLLPFSGRWFYGDLVFVVDPWIWLILGSAAVWLTIGARDRTPKKGLPVFLWLVTGAGASAAMALSLKSSNGWQAAIPLALRVAWFCGLGVILIGALLGWGRAGNRLAKGALVVLVLYWGGLWMARQQALQNAASSLPVQAASMAVWPEPTNPVLWKGAAEAGDHVYFRDLGLLPALTSLDPAGVSQTWSSESRVDARLRQSLNGSEAGREFLAFARFPAVSVVQHPDGSYAVQLVDGRFGLKLHATLDNNMNVTSSLLDW